MDKTPIYIKMCMKAKEIQKLDTKFVGNIYFDENTVLAMRTSDNEFVYCGSTTSLMGIYYELHKPIWLPRQDQLQDLKSFITLKDKFGNSQYLN